MAPAIICLLLCSLNVCILHIILIAYAMGSKAAFLTKSITSDLQISSKKKVIAIGVIIAEAVLQFFVFRLAFIKCASPPAEAAQSPHHLFEYFRVRNFEH